MEVIFKPKLLSPSNWRFLLKTIWVMLLLSTFNLIFLMMFLTSEDTSPKTIILIFLLSVGIILFIWSTLNDTSESVSISNNVLTWSKKSFLRSKSVKIDLNNAIKAKFVEYVPFKSLALFDIKYIYDFTESTNKDTPIIYSERTNTVVLYCWDSYTVQKLNDYLRNTFKNLQWI